MRRMAVSLTTAYNAEAVPLREVAELSVEQFRGEIVAAVDAGERLAAFFGRPLQAQRIELFAVLANPRTASLSLLRTTVTAYPSLTPECAECPQAHMFEREVAEQWGVRPEGHPWLKPVRVHDRSCGVSLQGAVRDPQSSSADFFAMRGEEIHEVAVGPVHAGIIEPGHFRFQCHGEQVYHLEISLGYQHRGVERMLAGGPDKRTIHVMETVAGDTSVGHATAYCQAFEGLAGRGASARAEVVRGIALELERIANHVGDLGALAGDVGYLPSASYCGRIRGDFLNLTALLCGSRFGRGMIRPGGIGFDAEPRRIAELSKRLDTALKDVAGSDCCGMLPRSRLVLKKPGSYHAAIANCSAWSGHQREPAASSRTCGTISPVAFSDSLKFRFPHGTPVTFLPAPGSAGLRSSARAYSSRSNWRGCRRAR